MPVDTKRLRRWGLFAVGLVVVGGIVLLDRQARPWGEGFVRSKGRDFGFEVEPELEVLGLTGAQLSRVRAERPGLTAETGEVRVRWNPGDLIGGRVGTVEIDSLDTRVDVPYWLEVLETAMASPSAPAPTAASENSEGLPSTVAASVLPVPQLAQLEAVETASVEGVWWAQPLPLDRLLLGSGTIHLETGETSLDFSGALDFADDGGERKLDWQAEGAGASFWARAQGARGSGQWSVQADWQGRHPWNLATELLPPEHRWNPDRLLAESGTRARWGDTRLELLAEGTGVDLRRASMLVHQGPLQLDRGEAESLLLRGASVAAVFDDGAWRQGEAVLDIDELGVVGGRTQGFMLNLGWSANDGWHLEVPEVAIAREDFDATLAARGFWRPEGAIEVQLAFADLNWGEFALEPFRWFLNERGGTAEGRLSELRSPAWPAWRLVQSHFSVEGVTRPAQTPRPWTFTGTTALEYRPEARTMATLEMTAVPREPVEGTAPPDGEPPPRILDWRGRIVGEIGETLARLSGALSSDRGFSLEASGEWSLIDALPYAFPFFPELKGLGAGGILTWRLVAESDPLLVARGRVEATLERGRLEWAERKLVAEGIEGEWVLRARGSLVSTEGVREVRIARFALGEEALENVLLRFRLLHREAFEVLALEADWMGGRIVVDPFTFNPLQPMVETIVRLEGVESAKLFPDPQTTGFLIDSKLSGTVPMSFSRESGLVVSRGLLEALNPGQAVLAITDEKALGRYLPLPDTLGLRQKVLDGIRQHFRFRSIRVSIFDPDTPLIPLEIDVEGGVQTPELEMESVRIKVPQRFERPLKGWESLLLLLSGGTVGFSE